MRGLVGECTSSVILWLMSALHHARSVDGSRDAVGSDSEVMVLGVLEVAWLRLYRPRENARLRD
jgi:hypothetical protein